MKEEKTINELTISCLSEEDEYSVTGGTGLKTLIKQLAKGAISWKAFILGIVLEYGDEFLEGFVEGWNDPYAPLDGYDKDGKPLEAE